MAWPRAVCALLLGTVLGVVGCAKPPPAEAPPSRPANVAGRQIVHHASTEDTLIELARSHGLGYVELVAANPGVDPWLPGAGTPLVLPAAHLLPPGPHEGIVINLAEQRLYFFDMAGTPLTFPIGISRAGWKTPLGETTVTRKVESPTWYPPASARREDPTLPEVVTPGPENPLGTRALYLGWPRYLIHGTNEPYGVGRRVSRGCIRLYPEHIEGLYEAVPLGTKVRVIDEPVKLAWVSDALYLEVHPTVAQAGQLEENGRFEPADDPEIQERVTEFAGASAHLVDWPVVTRVVRERRGVPVSILRGGVRRPDWL
jgi:L,D-transpeptidase ErfK/SrfK